MAPRRLSISEILDQGRTLAANYGRLGWYLGDQLIVSGSNFLMGALVARFLGIDAFGVFALAWMIVLFVQSLQSALVLSPMMSIGPKQSPEQTRSYYAVVAVHQIALAMASAVTVYAICKISGLVGWGEVSSELSLSLATTILFVQIHEFLRRYNFTRGHVRRVIVSDVVRYGSLIAALVYMMQAPGEQPGIPGVLYLTAGSALLAALVLLPGAPSLQGARARLVEVTQRHFRVSRWLVGSAILLWVTSNFFIIAAGAILGPAAVGALRAAQTLMGVTNVFFQAAESFVPPQASRIFHADGLAGLRRFIFRLTLFGASVTGLACLVLVVPARFWLTLVFGQEYSEYGFVVAGYGAWFFLLACLVPLRFAFQAVEKTRPDFTGYIIGSIFTLAASYPLARYFGVLGAITGVVVAQLVMLINLQIEYRRLLSPGLRS